MPKPAAIPDDLPELLQAESDVDMDADGPPVKRKRHVQPKAFTYSLGLFPGKDLKRQRPDVEMTDAPSATPAKPSKKHKSGVNGSSRKKQKQQKA